MTTTLTQNCPHFPHDIEMRLQPRSRPLDRLNLNLFVALDAILHSASLTEAARTVQLTQSGMSVSLKKLRGFFDDELVVHYNGEMRLTALAIALKPQIREVLQASHEALTLSLEFDPASDIRQVRMTAADVVELTFLSRVAGRIAVSAPRVEMISIPFSAQPIDALLRDGIDVAIVSESAAQPGYPSLRLFSDTMSCLVWAGNRSVGETMTEAQYFSARHAAMFDTPERLAHPVGAALRQADLDRRIVMRVSTYASLPHVIVGTDMVVTTLTRFAQLCAESLPVRVVPLPVGLAPIGFVAQWQPYRTDEPIIRWLLEQLEAAARSL